MKFKKVTALLLTAAAVCIMAGCANTKQVASPTPSVETSAPKEQQTAEVSTKLSKDYSPKMVVSAFGYDPAKYVKLPKDYKKCTSIDDIVSKSKIKVPDFLIDPAVNKILNQLKSIAKKSGKSLKAYVEGFSGKSLSSYKKELAQGQSKLAKQNLVLAAIAQDQKFSVTQKDYDSWLKDVQKNTGNSKAGIIKAYGGEKEAVVGCVSERARNLIESQN